MPNTPSNNLSNTRLTAALFGLSLPLPHTPPPNAYGTIWASLLRTLRARGTVAITGPSGGGKTSLLRAALPRLAARTSTPLFFLDASAPATEPHCPLVDSLPGHLRDVLNTLAAAGLADARVLLTPVRNLSAGERARRMLALALHHAQGFTLVIDEFGSTLDARTAKGVAITLGRAAQRSQTGLLIATVHPGLVQHLGANVLRIHCPLAAPPRLHKVPANGVAPVPGDAGASQ